MTPSAARRVRLRKRAVAYLHRGWAWLIGPMLLVMAAYLANVTRAPLTSFIIMMEMTDSHHMLMPLMATALIASTASKAVCPQPLYHALASRMLPAPTSSPPP